MTDAVYCTLLLSDAYLKGAVVLAHSLRENGTTAKLAVLYTPQTLQAETVAQLESTYDILIPVNPISNTATPGNLFLMDRPDLINTFTKIELWRQTQFKRIVYLDADILALRAPDELLTLPLAQSSTDTDTNTEASAERIAAAPDAGWPDCFNSGVIALTPNLDDYNALLDLATHGVSFDGADQGLLNMYFEPGAWKRLSFGYNCTVVGGTSSGGGSSAGSVGNQYQYAPAFRHFERSVSLVHFVGYSKPWSGSVHDMDPSDTSLVGKWWDVYRRSLPPPEPCPLDAPSEIIGLLGSENYGYIPTYQPPELPQPPQPSQPYEPFQPPPQAHQPSLLHLEDQDRHQPQYQHHQPQTQEHHQHQHQDQEQGEHKPSWDASREPPPPNTKPEGIALQQQTYHMSTDTRVYQPEPNLPTPIPIKPETRKLPQIFPWESRAPKPTRVFADDGSTSDWQMVEKEIALDTKPRDVPKAFASIQREQESVQSTAVDTDDQNIQKEEWVAATAGKFLDVLKVVYLYGVFTGVHRD